ERGEMSGEEDDALAGRAGAPEIFEADDLVRRQAAGGEPPRGARLEHAERQRAEMRAAQPADVRLGFFGETQAQVDERDVAADRDDVPPEPAERGGEGALHAPRQPREQPEKRDPGPHGPVARVAEVGGLAGAGHRWRAA